MEFENELDAVYAVQVLNMIKVYGKAIRLNKSSSLARGGNRETMNVGANIHIGNLDPEVDEKFLFDTFSAFGPLLQVGTCPIPHLYTSL